MSCLRMLCAAKSSRFTPVNRRSVRDVGSMPTFCVSHRGRILNPAHVVITSDKAWRTLSFNEGWDMENV